MKSLAELHEFYRTELAEAIRPFEARRKSILTRLIITGVVVVVLTLVALFVGAAKGAPHAALFVLIPGAIVFALVAYFSMRGYKSEFKRAVIQPIVKFIDPGLHYSPEGYKWLARRFVRQARSLVDGKEPAADGRPGTGDPADPKGPASRPVEP